MWACDSGYHEGENIKFLSDTAIDGYMPDNNSRKARNPYDKKNFVYDHAQDQYLCPAGQPVIFVGEHLDRQKNKMIRHYRGKACAACSQQQNCTKTRDGIRYLKMFPHEMQRNAMAKKMATEKAQEIYKLRQQIIEPVFGDIKENKGMRGFLTRGLKDGKGRIQSYLRGSEHQKDMGKIKGQ